MKITTKEVLVTPEIAAKYLKNNVNNRDVKPGVVEAYAAQMRNNEWKEGNPQPISFSVSGLLIDGQHRLSAIIKSGKAQRLMIAENVSDDMFSVIDRGSKRTPGDIFKMADIKNPILTSAIIVKFLNTGKRINAIECRPTMQQLMEEYQKRPDFWNHIVDFSTNAKKSFGGFLEPSLLGGWYAQCSDIDQSQADIYFKALISGIGFVNEKDPILQYRQYLIKNKEDKHLKNVLSSIRHALFIKSWNMLREKKLHILKYSPKQEKFPTLK